ncbi:MAG: Na+/H+ antiporter NhaA [Alphaproteobacteria bacterium]|nr:Na+/H+ antiporter NhaA [Alphaproteobacteria bacterium]
MEGAGHGVVHAVEEIAHSAVEKAGYVAAETGSGAKRIINAATHFLHLEASGGIILAIAALLAIIIANTPLFGLYDSILNHIKFRIGFDDLQGSFDYEIKKSILHWINDGFMALFFLLVGLEIKREIVSGELSSRGRILLPALAAGGGMIVPALIFWLINQSHPQNLSGWAIPAATDIAFALGVLALLGSRAPTRLKVLLTAIAVIDDLGAILIIAFFYTSGLAIQPLYVGAIALLGLILLNRRGVLSISPYIILGTILWVAVLKSGVHATLAGVLTALFIPMKRPDDSGGSEEGAEESPGERLEHALHPWVAYAILPIFAFANAGLPFTGMSLKTLSEPLLLGIVAGLSIGKQLGIFSMLVLAIKTGLSPMPRGVTWLQLYAVSVLCGIGFTMSLFIGSLAFEDEAMQVYIRLGVLLASLISAGIGYLILKYAPPARNDTPGIGSKEEAHSTS